jgi:hypothetical protein
MSTGSTQPFNAAGTVTLAGTTTSVSAGIPAGDSVLVYNGAATVAFVAFGNGAATATAAAGVPIPPGGSRLLYIGPNVNFVAAILASGTGNVYVSYGSGTVY